MRRIGFVVVKVSAPVDDLEKIRQYCSVMSGVEAVSVLSLFENQMVQITATFGPNCKAELLNTGVEEVSGV